VTLTEQSTFAEGDYRFAIRVGIPDRPGYHPAGSVARLSATEAARLGELRYASREGVEMRPSEEGTAADLTHVRVVWLPVIEPARRGPGRPPKPRDEERI
jgi:hypothetical protein